jgi:Tfp pilus assembly protein PilF
MVFHAGHKAEAVIAANAVAEALPDTVDAWVVLAYVALQNGEKSLAKTAAQRAIGLDPNQRTARELLEQASAP